MRVLKFFIQTFVFLGLFYWFFGGGFDKQVASDLQGIHNKVATDAVEQYQIAVRNGTRIDRCVQAGMVTAAFLQAKNEKDYASWKAVQNAECKAAGMPLQ